NSKKVKQEPPAFLNAKETIRLNQLIYKDTIETALAKYAPGFEAIFIPTAVNGNYATIVKDKAANRYALIIRGSVMEFSNEGFQNFIMQDFNIFRIKEWNYTDTVKEANISYGAWIGFQNLLQLKDKKTGLGIKDFIEQNLPAHSSVVITGHSLGGNLAYPFAGYLKKELKTDKKIRLQLITFGAPAAGNAAFVQDIEEKFPDAERYAGSKDIAPMFPDIEKIGELATAIGLDSVLQLGKLNIGGVDTKLNAGTLFNIANEVLERTNVISKSHKYIQSQKHLRYLTDKDLSSSPVELTTNAIFNRAYQYHKVDMYAELLGVGLLEK
ncbi:MAG TPA: hypothetical protein VF476_04730, partial [Chitinophagaceae bacterium]